MPHPGLVILDVYNLQGQRITRLMDRLTQAGNHELTWDASNLASGMYIYRLQVGEFTDSRKMVLVR